MKRILISIVIMLLLGAGVYAIFAFSPPATCTGNKSCNACKNCKYCKHCSKEGGTCGVCK